ncbi:MAG TPA: PRC-barrel domain-containing protein [Caulobacteraceae bacterium]|nr:PRC-barrel domain-containing protein [Caulobacteraceae bacterium]
MTDEALMKSSDVLGRAVSDTVGAKLGTIREMYLDRQDGSVRFAIVEVGGFIGGGKFHPVPWRLIRFDEATETFASSLTREALKSAPSYDRDQLGNPAYGWGEQTERFFATL